MTIGKPVFPKEHGLWAWVFLPLCVGGACANGNHYALAPLLAAAFAGFLLLTPARIVVKNALRKTPQETNVIFWGGVYLTASLVFTWWSVAPDPRLLVFYGVLAAGFALGVHASYAGYQRSAAFEYGGLVFLSLGAFFAAFAVAGGFDYSHLSPWALTLLFMLDRSIQSRRVVRMGGFLPVIANQDPRFAARLKPVFLLNAGISITAFVFALVIAEKLHAPLTVNAAFVPGAFLTLWFYKKPPALLKTLGFAELYLSIFFGVAFPFLLSL